MLQGTLVLTHQFLHQIEPHVCQQRWECQGIDIYIVFDVLHVEPIHIFLLLVRTVERVLQHQNSFLVEKIIDFFEHGNQPLVSKCQMNPFRGAHYKDSVVALTFFDVHKIVVADTKVIWEAIVKRGCLYSNFYLRYSLGDLIVVLLVLLLKVQRQFFYPLKNYLLSVLIQLVSRHNFIHQFTCSLKKLRINVQGHYLFWKESHRDLDRQLSFTTTHIEHCSIDKEGRRQQSESIVSQLRFLARVPTQSLFKVPQKVHASILLWSDMNVQGTDLPTFFGVLLFLPVLLESEVLYGILRSVMF